MIIERFLQESATEALTEKVEPMFSSYITGEDPNELSVMTSEANEEFRNIDSNILYAESLMYIAQLGGNSAAVERLQENVVTDTFSKISAAIQKLWAKVKAFFAQLFKSIAVQVISVKKSLAGIDKYLKKDFTNFSYVGYDWKDTTIGTDISNAVVKAINEKKALADSVVADAQTQKANGDPSNMGKLENGDAMTSVAAIAATCNALGSKVTTLEQAKIAINVAYGTDGAQKTFTGKPDLANMVKFLEGFENNGVLKNLQKQSGTSYSTALTTIKGMQSKVSSLGNDSEGKSIGGPAVSNLKAIASSLTSILGAYNGMMNACISNEKARFSEYRGVVAKAVRYNGGKTATK